MGFYFYHELWNGLHCMKLAINVNYMLFILYVYIYTSLKLDVVFILENKMFVMSSKLYLIKKKISRFYFIYFENLPNGTSSDFAFLNWDGRCLGNCSIDRYIVFMHSLNSCHPKCTNAIQTFSTLFGFMMVKLNFEPIDGKGGVGV